MAVDRFAAQQGQAVRLEVTFKLAGTVFDPFEIRQVEIRGAADNLIATFSGASIVRDTVGQYYVDWVIPATEPLEIHFDKWYATASSGGTEEVFTFNFLVLAFGSSSPGAAYLSLDEARAFLPSDTGITDFQLMNQVALVQEIIETKTGRTFLPITEGRAFNGTGKQVLPIKHPILRVSEARVLSCSPVCDDGSSDRLIDVCSIRISKSQTMLGLGNVQRYSDRFDGSGYSFPIGCCGTWPSGFMNIRITGDWGMTDTVPLQIKRVAGILLRHAGKCDDPYGLPSNAFKAESIPGDRDYTLREVWTNVTLNNMTGFPDVDAILSSFQPRLRVGVV